MTKRNRIIILCAFGELSAREFRKKKGGMDRKGVSLEDRQEGRVSGLTQTEVRGVMHRILVFNHPCTKSLSY